MHKRTSTPARMNSIALHSKRKGKACQIDSKNEVLQFDDWLIKGKEMTEKQFEEFIRGNEQFDDETRFSLWKSQSLDNDPICFLI